MGTLPERLLWARKTAGLTTRELAAEAQVSLGYPSALECGQVKKPSVEAVKRLADALGVSFEWVYWGAGRTPSERSLKRRGASIKKKAAA